METFYRNILAQLSSINWDGPAMFVIIVLAVLALFKQWRILLITLLTIVLGWGAQDLIITNIATGADIVSVPLVVYCVGGGLIIILSLIAFLRIAV